MARNRSKFLFGSIGLLILCLAFFWSRGSFRNDHQESQASKPPENTAPTDSSRDLHSESPASETDSDSLHAKDSSEVAAWSHAGVYKSNDSLVELTVTSEREIHFHAAGPWTELKNQKFKLADVTLVFETSDFRYWVDFLDPDPEVISLSRRVKPFVEPAKRDYLQARRVRK